MRTSELICAPKPYLYEKKWHGSSCVCEGGYRMGHTIGCQWAEPKAELRQVSVDLNRAMDNNDAEEVLDLQRIKAKLEAHIEDVNPLTI